MSVSNSSSGGGGADDRSAEELFAEFLSRIERGENPDFDALCDEHTSKRDALLGLRSIQMGETGADDVRTGSWRNPFAPGTAGVPERDPRPERIGPYRITDTLGSGGFGVVYLAEQTQPRRRVALKVLRRGMDSGEVLTRFEAERQALARMDHPHVAKVFDAGTTESGQSYFVMEHVDGVRLSTYCEERSLDLDARLALFTKICEGVHHAHRQAALLHRDLKPGNILVTESDAGEPVPKIIDFGLVKALEDPLVERTLQTEVGQIMGTPEYMSPEQASLDGLDLDARVDVYALGVILYELVTGELPIPSETIRRTGAAGMARAIAEYQPAVPSSRLFRAARRARREGGDHANGAPHLAHRFGRDLDWIIMKAIEKDRVRRYANVADLRDDVERFRGGDGVVARPPSAAYRLRKLVRRHRIALGFAGSVLVVALVVAVIGQVLAIRERSARVAELVSRGRALWSEYLDGKSQLEDLEARYTAVRRKNPTWLPVWDRGDELEAWYRLEDLRTELEGKLENATQALVEARNVEVDADDEKREAQELLSEIAERRWAEAVSSGGLLVGPSYFRKLADSYSDEALAGLRRESIVVRSDPPGAAVHCFRYVLLRNVGLEDEGRLVPLPFDPRRVVTSPGEGIVGGPFLRVERIWKKGRRGTALGPFRPGDILRSVNSREVRTLTELASALEGVPHDSPVKAEFDREGARHVAEWSVFPRDLAATLPERFKFEPNPLLENRLLRPYYQFGLTFEANPLDLEKARVGTATEDGLRLDLPDGSYLLVLTLDGRASARYPISVPLGLAIPALPIRLPDAREVPPGFIAIPRGPLVAGGDFEAFGSLRPEVRPLPEFMIARVETTAAEWLEFVNSPSMRGRIDADGRLDGTDLTIVPRFWISTNSGWSLGSDRPGSPVGNVSHLAVLEYLGWRNDRAEKRGERWRYRLPTNAEWERAARGVDRRVYPWGNYNVWSHSSSFHGNLVMDPPPVGSSPFDESVFGVRDLAGSVLEHIGETLPGTENRYYRGGGFDEMDDGYFRVAGRHSMLPTVAPDDAGFRLVAYPAASEK